MIKDNLHFIQKNTEENYVYYPTTSSWHYNGYSDEWYSYGQPQPPGSTFNVPSWIISSNLGLQVPPPGIFATSFGVPPFAPFGISTPSSDVQPPPPGITPSHEADSSISKIDVTFIQSQEHYFKADESSLLWKKDNSIISKTDSFEQQRTFQNKSMNHRNDEISNVDDCVEEEDMDLSD